MQRFASFVRNEESNHGAEKSAALKKTIMANPIFKILIHRTEEGIPRDPIQVLLLSISFEAILHVRNIETKVALLLKLHLSPNGRN